MVKHQVRANEADRIATLSFYCLGASSYLRMTWLRWWLQTNQGLNYILVWPCENSHKTVTSYDRKMSCVQSSAATPVSVSYKHDYKLLIYNLLLITYYIIFPDVICYFVTWWWDKLTHLSAKQQGLRQRQFLRVQWNGGQRNYKHFDCFIRFWFPQQMSWIT